MDNFSIDPIIYKGRPQTIQNHLSKEIRTYELLDNLHIPYERLDHEAIFTIEACHSIDKILGIEICKNLFYVMRRKQDSIYL